MHRISMFAAVVFFLIAGNAMAESINCRLGLNGRIGAIVPLEDSRIRGITFDTDPGFAGGGGLVYGLSDSLAVELDVIHAPSMDVEIGGTNVSEAEMTDISLGMLYRMTPGNKLVPYIGVGVDAIKGDISDSKLDWTVGGHVNGGVDYFLNRSIDLNADVRGIFAAKSDTEQNDVTVGKFDPMSFVATIGVRLFLPETL
ncbi:porin family protein [bacterium]|nr:MAG: porin family protein [bacterium]